MRKICLLFILLFTFTVPLVASSAPPPITALTQKQKARLEQIVYITRTGERYHSGSCQHLRRSKIPIKLKDAIEQGYTPCRVCRP
jgi:competence protein ComEC